MPPPLSSRQRNKLTAMTAIQDVAHTLLADSSFADVTVDQIANAGRLPVTSTQRMIPTGDFHPGLAIGQPAPDFELPNHLGETVSFHADRDGSRAALLFYRSAVW